MLDTAFRWLTCPQARDKRSTEAVIGSTVSSHDNALEDTTLSMEDFASLNSESTAGLIIDGSISEKRGRALKSSRGFMSDEETTVLPFKQVKKYGLVVFRID